MLNQIKPYVVTPEVVGDNTSMATQVPAINLNLEIKNELEASAQQGARLMLKMLQVAIKEAAETSPDTLQTFKSINITQPIEIRFGEPELSVVLK